jgi:hypothetical protein
MRPAPGVPGEVVDLRARGGAGGKGDAVGAGAQNGSAHGVAQMVASHIDVQHGVNALTVENVVGVRRQGRADGCRHHQRRLAAAGEVESRQHLAKAADAAEQHESAERL